ncbi:MAG: radical SAM protein [bacterium]|nr:radical SAM protein [bacterium]
MSAQLPLASPPCLSLRLAVTNACDLRCVYCRPESAASSIASYDRLGFDDFLWLVRTVQQRFALRKVHLTGGEPLMRDGLPALIRALAATGIPDLALTTNGQRLASLAPALAHAGLRRVNVSLDSLHPDVYARITRGAPLQPVLDGIAAARAAGLAIKLNMVVLRGWNDHELLHHVHFALTHGCDLRFLELMPISCATKLFLNAYVPASQILSSLAASFSLTPLPTPPGRPQLFRLANGSGAVCTVSTITSVSSPFCNGCHRLRFTADGLLLGCLARPHTLPLLPIIRARDADRLHHALRLALQHKRSDGSFNQPTPMCSIGG